MSELQREPVPAVLLMSALAYSRFAMRVSVSGTAHSGQTRPIRQVVFPESPFYIVPSSQIPGSDPGKGHSL